MDSLTRGSQNCDEMNELLSSEGRRPQRVAAQAGDTKRKLAVDSSSESDNELDASFGGSSVNRKKSLASRSRSSIGETGTPTMMTKRTPKSPVERPSQNEYLAPSIHHNPAKRLRSSSNASSSSLSSVPSDIEPQVPSKQPKKLSKALEDSDKGARRRKPAQLPHPPPSTPLPSVARSSQPRARRKSQPTTPIASPLGQQIASSLPRMHSSGLVLPTPIRARADEWRLDEVICPHSAVFVKLTCAPGPDSEISDTGNMWWPATVTSTSNEVSAPLGMDDKFHILPVISPSPNNMVSLPDPMTGLPRFKLSNYFCGLAGRGSSERNKRWSQAMKDVAADTSDDDSFMDIPGHSQSTGEQTSIDEKRPQKREFAEMQCEEEKHLIGQIVLSLMKEGNLSYWPGTIVDVFLRARGTTVLYKVEFWDKTTASVPRRCLFTPEDRQFFTCQIGARQVYGRPKTEDQDGSSRSPDHADNFAAFPLRKQLTYVQPILLSIIRDDYPPARELVDRFYAGSDMRKVQRFGGLDPEEITEGIRAMFLEGFHPVDEIATPKGQSMNRSGSAVPESEPPSSGTVVLSAATSDAETTATSDTAEAEGTKGSFQEVPSRLTGSARYEELTEKGKLLFCTDVLATQAALQLILWRTGARRRANMFPPDEELSLYDKGNVLLDDWTSNGDLYTCVERLRKNNQAVFGLNADRDQDARVLVGGTSTRPKWK